MGPLPLAAAALSVVALAAILAGMRHRGVEGNRAFELAAVLVASALGFAAALAVVLTFFQIWDRLPDMEHEVLRDAVAGAFAGATLYLGVRVALFEGTARACQWVLRQADAGPWPVGMHSFAVNLAIWTCLWSVGLMGVGRLEGAWAAFVAPVLFTWWLPIYESQIRPWIEFARARTLDGPELAELRDWLDEVSGSHAVPRFKVRIREGSLNNAYAMGGIFGNLIVIGEGLLKGMSSVQLKAILAHEVAHVVRRDVPWLLAASLIGVSLFVVGFGQWIAPILDAGGLANYAIGFLYSLPLIGITFVAIPGAVSILLEFRADANAVRILGRWKPLASALKRLAELDDVPLDAWSHTHPSVSSRIRRMQTA